VLQTVLAAVLCAMVAQNGPAPDPVTVPSLQDSVTVERLLLEARVLDAEGRPVRGLAAGDFELLIGGDAVPVLSVDWIEGFGRPPLESRPGPAPRSSRAVVGSDPSERRYSVLLIQRDLDPSRIVQLMRIKSYALELIDDLAEADRLAVLLHENGLHLLADFTGDREGLRRVVDEAVVVRGEVPPVRPSDGASLRAVLGESALRGAVHIETALLRLAEALEEVPGSKTVFFFAWGMGVFTGGGILERPDQARATQRLRDADTTLLTVDLTNADYHSLETPLIRATRETGGLYVKGHVRPSIALERLRNAAAGHYILAIAPPEGERSLRSVRLRVPGTDYEVLHPESLPD
jgi:VWFA-related protein